MDYGSMPMHFLAQGDDPPVIMIPEPVDNEDAQGLPQVKIKRNYVCAQCEYFTQNPRSYLMHLRHVHNERMRIYECPHCTYASRHSQKMHRHVSMVHDPERPERRRPGPAPRLREEYYADFVDEMHKRRNLRLGKKRRTPPEATLGEAAEHPERDDDDRATAAGPSSTSTAVRDRRQSEDSDDDDRLVIDNSDDDLEVPEDAQPAPEGMPEVDDNENENDDDDDDEEEQDEEGNRDEHKLNRRARDVRLDMDPVTRQYKCSSCTFTSKTPSLVARHESVVHLKKRFYRCSKCTYVTHLRARYTKHYKYHTMPLIKCAECDFRTPYKWNLDRHVKNHGGLGKYTCRACSFSSEIRQSLTVHEMNHHQPPVGPPGEVRVPHKRRRNKVGGTELAGGAAGGLAVVGGALHGLLQGARPAAKISSGQSGLKQESEMLRMEWEESEYIQTETGAGSAGVPGGQAVAPVAVGRGPETDATAPSSTPTAAGAAGTAGHSATSRLPHHQALRCSQCDYRTPYFADMSRHMSNTHGSSKMARAPPTLTPANQPPAKRVAKPLPNLIPIQVTPLGASRPTCPAPQGAQAPQAPLPSVRTASITAEDDAPALATAIGDDSNQSSSENTKKKNFLDQLKLYPGNPSDPGTLVCARCGHEAKCMSELVRHNKLHQGRSMGLSTRCPHCRHRCKTSTDLAEHLKMCLKAAKAVPGTGPEGGADLAGLADQSAVTQQSEGPTAAPRKGVASITSEEENTRMTSDSEGTMEGDFCPGEGEDTAVEGDDEDGEGEAETPADETVPKADCNFVGVETAPGYGLVTTQTDYDTRTSKENSISTVINFRKVFKCPHCPFWAATASRFHVHMVGHLNKKPFACSVCKYRSNWRWDITKHIRVKEVRDPLHTQAKTLMTDETGRRNYSKYNQHMLWLKVAEPSPEVMNAMVSGANKSNVNGKTPSGDPVPILPAPPKLMRAPTPRTVVQVSSAAPGSLLRPPPPLQAGTSHATHLIILPAGMRLGQSGPQQQSCQPAQQQSSQQQQQQSLKRPADSPPKPDSDPKKPTTEIKKTVWRCKQCHFRDGDRHVVLTHVKGHYRQQQEAAMAKLKGSGGKNTAPIRSENVAESPQTVLKKVPFHCDTCPFVTVSETVMQAHASCHKERDDVFFKCFYCPFYVSSKEELMQHITVHRQNMKDESSAATSEKASTTRNSSPLSSNQAEVPSNEVQVKKEEEVSSDLPAANGEDGQKESQSLPAPPSLDFSNFHESPVCWVFREEKLQRMLRCRHCPHVNLRRTNMLEHEKMHLKRIAQSSGDAVDSSTQYSPYPCPDCSYLCNNAGVLSSHMKVHLPTYPQVYGLYEPFKNDLLQMTQLAEKYKLKLKTAANQKVSPPKEANVNKLSKINVMSLLDPNQSLTDAVLAMKKKFNLELDGEPFAEPIEDAAESPPCSPLKQLNEGIDPSVAEIPEEKQLHFCQQCPARFLFRKELGIHSRFHNLHLIHKCDNCSYTARQRSHLQAHLKVHTEDYQDRTSALLKMYKVHKEFSRPKIVCVANNSGGLGSTICIVVTSSKSKSMKESSSSVSPRFHCHKCPAAFFKLDAMHSHLNLHGSNNPHKCRVCDYAVKTFGNLIKHMMTHGFRASIAKKMLEDQIDVTESVGSSTSENSVPTENTVKVESQSSNDVCASQATECPETSSMALSVKGGKTIDSGKEDDILKDDKSIVEEKDKENTPAESVPKNQNAGFAMGSPEFVYPTYCRNGRVKVKRYKCHKCPSAFEKRDQYLIHLSLHGSKQRYTCTKCDYSVKYYANHMQHIRRHKLSEDAKVTGKDDSVSNASESEEFIPEDSENVPSSTSPPSPTRCGKSTGGKGEKLSVADKQAMMVLQQRRAKGAAASREALDKNYWCSHCPYSSPRRDQVESHMRRHSMVSGVRNAFVCDHCDYSVPNKHFLRDHSKLHFNVSKAPRPDAYMICDRLELWASSGFSAKSKSKGRVLIFQDKGPSITSDRFLPTLASDIDDEEDDVSSRVYVNPRTFESEGFIENGNKDHQDPFEEVESQYEDDGESDVKDSDLSSDVLEKVSNKDESESSNVESFEKSVALSSS